MGRRVRGLDPRGAGGGEGDGCGVEGEGCGAGEREGRRGERGRPWPRTSCAEAAIREGGPWVCWCDPWWGRAACDRTLASGAL